MKAIIDTLWDTGIDIITTEDDCNDITSLSDLRKCDNVLVGEKISGTSCTEIMLGDSIFDVSFRQVSHPTGMGKLYICEIYRNNRRES